MSEESRRKAFLAIPYLQGILDNIAAILDDIAIIQGQIATIQSQIATIQGQIATIQAQIITIQANIAALATQESVSVTFTVNDVNWIAPVFTVPPPVPANADFFVATAIRQGGVVSLYSNPGVADNISNFLRSAVVGPSLSSMNFLHDLPANMFPEDGSAKIAIGPLLYFDNSAGEAYMNVALVVRSDGTATMIFDRLIASTGLIQLNVGYSEEGFTGTFPTTFTL